MNEKAIKITGLRRLEDTTRRLNIHGDNWHTTWSADGRQFIAACDSRGGPEIEGYTGQYYNSRVFELIGSPDHPTFRHQPGFPDLDVVDGTRQTNRYYGFGILSLDEKIYHFLSTPNRPFAEPEPRFVGVKLIYSPDSGKSWRNQDGGSVTWEKWEQRSRDNMVFYDEPGESFSLLTVLQMGRNYEHNQDGYVYVYAPNGNVEGAMNQLVMFRVPRERILDRGAYEYFVSRNSDGSASWSSDIGQRGIVHTFPTGWVNTEIHPYAWHPSIAYNAALGVYVMVNWGMGCDANGEWFCKPSYLGFWTSPHPWGPWTQIHEEEAWMPAGDSAARAYQPQIIPAWITEDGCSFWLAWTDYQFIGQKLPYYCFNYQRVEILTDN